MADPNDRNEGNVPGSFFTDSECIDCNLCAETAPEFFQASDDGYHIVHKQPVTDDEIALAEEALEGCPAEAIGNNGWNCPS